MSRDSSRLPPARLPLEPPQSAWRGSEQTGWPQCRPLCECARRTQQRALAFGHRKPAIPSSQVWLAVYNIVCEPAIRRRYQFNSYRKNVLLRLRGFLNEKVVDQIPILTDLQRALDEMTLTDAHSAAESKPAYGRTHRLPSGS